MGEFDSIAVFSSKLLFQLCEKGPRTHFCCEQCYFCAGVQGSAFHIAQLFEAWRSSFRGFYGLALGIKYPQAEAFPSKSSLRMIYFKRHAIPLE